MFGRSDVLLMHARKVKGSQADETNIYIQNKFKTLQE